MKLNVKLLLFFCSCLLVINQATAQKVFKITLHFPASLDVNKLIINYDNGKGDTRVIVQDNKKRAVFISAPYYGKYAAIILRYFKNNSGSEVYFAPFYVSGKAAEIFFSNTDTTQSPFDSYKLINALDFKAERNSMVTNMAGELKDLHDFNKLNEEKLDANDSVTERNSEKLQEDVHRKELEYITRTGSSYYSLWYFRKYIVPTYEKNAEAGLQVFNSIFCNSLKDSEEGLTVSRFFQGKINLAKKLAAPHFVSTDKNGKKINLKNYRGKKAVLLVFWATWCGPCMEEVPIIKEIQQSFSSQQLQIISVAYPSDYPTYLKVIAANKMNWVNIYNDLDLIRNYGDIQAIPRVYLINKGGNIIYSSTTDEVDGSLSVLKKLLNKTINN